MHSASSGSWATQSAVVAAALRAAGMRMTEPRRRVLQALERLGHATPEELSAAVAADGERALPPSTIYRNLDSLAQVGLVRHSHVTHGAPDYHLPGHGDHLHLVCRDCGRISEAEPELAANLERSLLDVHGFAADVTHTSVHGTCRECGSTSAGPRAGAGVDLEPKENG